MNNTQLAIMIVIILVGATALIISLAVAYQAQKEFEQQYTMQQFYNNLLKPNK